MENSKNKTDNFLKAIKKYADEQRSASDQKCSYAKKCHADRGCSA